ncbi:MAG: FkbM family methyltransferase [Sphingobium sp.]
MKSYAQNFEDVILWRALKDVTEGFFIDVGAHHPIKDSVSKAFSNSGWKGIHVEPIPFYAELLRNDRRNDTVIQSVVSNIRGLIEFYNIEGTGLSTSLKTIADQHSQNNFQYSTLVVSSITLDDVFALCPDQEVHWLKIDVEGMEQSVLQGWKDYRRRPWIIVIESTHPGTQVSNYSEWEILILEKQYKHVYSDGLNRFYLSIDHVEMEEIFSYPPNIFDGFQLAPESDHVIEIVRDHQNRIGSLEARIADHAQAAQSEKDELLARAELDAEQILAASRAREDFMLQVAAARQEELTQGYKDFSRRMEAMRQDVIACEKDIRGQAQADIDGIRAEADHRISAALERESMAALVALDRQTELERKCADLRAQLEMSQNREQNLDKSVREREQENRQNLEYLKTIFSSEMQNLISKIEHLHECIFEHVRKISQQDLMIYEYRKDISGLSQRITAKNALIEDLRRGFFSKISKALFGDFLEKYSPKENGIARGFGQINHIANAKINSKEDKILSADSEKKIAAALNGKIQNTQQNQMIDENFHQGLCQNMSFQKIRNAIDLMCLPIDDFIKQSYLLILDRNPEDHEVRLHSSAISAGIGRGRVLLEIYSSAERMASYEKMTGTQTDVEYISWLYDRYLNRPVDGSGYAHYAAMLDQGKARDQVKKDIAASREARFAATLWSEIDTILKFEQQQKMHERRWYRLSRQSRRSHNQTHEAILHSNHGVENRLRAEIHHLAQGQFDTGFRASRHQDGDSADIRNDQGANLGVASQPVSPLAAVDTSWMGPEARRVLLRLQHVKGASMEKGHA